METFNCQAKINDHFNIKYKCTLLHKHYYEVTITYTSGHLKGKTKTYTKVLCEKHAKIFRYNLNRKAGKGHIVLLEKLSFQST